MRARRALALALAVVALGACSRAKGDGIAHLEPAPLPTNSITSITLDRHGCFGTCPVYTVKFSRGDVATYYGKRYVDKIGRYSGHVDFDLIAAWLDTQSLPKESSVFGNGVIDAESIDLTVIRSNKSVVTESHNNYDLPIAVTGVVAAIDGFAEAIRWRQASALDPFLGNFVEKRNSDTLATLALYPGQTDVDAQGDAMTFSRDRCAVNGFARSDFELRLRLGGSHVTATRGPNDSEYKAATGIPIAISAVAGAVTLGQGPDARTYRRVSAREYDAVVNSFTLQFEDRPRPPDCNGTGPN